MAPTKSMVSNATIPYVAGNRYLRETRLIREVRLKRTPPIGSPSRAR